MVRGQIHDITPSAVMQLECIMVESQLLDPGQSKRIAINMRAVAYLTEAYFRFVGPREAGDLPVFQLIGSDGIAFAVLGGATYAEMVDRFQRANEVTSVVFDRGRSERLS